MDESDQARHVLRGMPFDIRKVRLRAEKETESWLLKEGYVESGDLAALWQFGYKAAIEDMKDAQKPVTKIKTDPSIGTGKFRVYSATECWEVDFEKNEWKKLDRSGFGVENSYTAVLRNNPPNSGSKP
jgi:hypothetical protein